MCHQDVFQLSFSCGSEPFRMLASLPLSSHKERTLANAIVLRIFQKAFLQIAPMCKMERGNGKVSGLGSSEVWRGFMCWWAYQ